jgi:hypothetical protein
MSNDLSFTSFTYILYILEKQKPQSEPIKRLRCLVFKAISSSPREISRMFALIEGRVFPGNRIYLRTELQHEIRGGTKVDDRYIPLTKYPVVKKLCGPKTKEGYRYYYDHSSSEWEKMSRTEKERMVSRRLQHVSNRQPVAESECKEQCEKFLRNENNFNHAFKELKSICPTVHGSAYEVVNMSTVSFEGQIIRKLLSLDKDIFYTLSQMQSFDLGDQGLEYVRDWIRERQDNETVNGVKSIYSCYK